MAIPLYSEMFLDSRFIMTSLKIILQSFMFSIYTIVHMDCFQFLFSTYCNMGSWGGVVVKALRYKPAGRWFDSRWCHWNFSLT
jgi:hypothetical protein